MRRWRVVAAFVAIGLAAVAFIHFNSTKSLYNSTNNTMAMSSLTLKIPAFADGALIPAEYTCDESQLSPAVEISGVPESAVSLALIMDDPDVPKALRPDGVFVHWVLFNMPATTMAIPEGGSIGVVGANGGGQNAYAGPCPPPQYEPSTHRYIFKLYALDATLPLSVGATAAQVEGAMKGHIIGETQYIGRYKRQ